MKDTPKMMKREIDFMKKKGAPKDMLKHEMAEAKGMKPAKKMACGGAVKKMSSGGMTKRGYGAARKG